MIIETNKEIDLSKIYVKEPIERYIRQVIFSSLIVGIIGTILLLGAISEEPPMVIILAWLALIGEIISGAFAVKTILREYNLNSKKIVEIATIPQSKIPYSELQKEMENMTTEKS